MFIFCGNSWQSLKGCYLPQSLAFSGGRSRTSAFSILGREGKLPSGLFAQVIGVAKTGWLLYDKRLKLCGPGTLLGCFFHKRMDSFGFFLWDLKCIWLMIVAYAVTICVHPKVWQKIFVQTVIWPDLPNFLACQMRITWVFCWTSIKSWHKSQVSQKHVNLFLLSVVRTEYAQEVKKHNL